MALNRYILRINAGPRQYLEALNVAFTGLELHNMQTDRATLQWTRKRAAEACPVANGDRVEIWISDRRIFVGKAQLGVVSHEGCQIMLNGPWQWLSQYYWQVEQKTGQPVGPKLGDTFTTHPGAGEWWNGSAWVPFPTTITWTYDLTYSYTPGASVGTQPVDNAWTSRSWMFGPLSGYTFLPAHYQMAYILYYLNHIEETPLVAEGIKEFGLPLAVSKRRTVQDLHVDEAIRQSVAPHVDASCWFDYSGSGLPVINFRVAKLEVPLVYSSGVSPLVDHDLDVLHELMPSGVMICMQIPDGTATGRGARTFIDRYPAGTISYQPGILMQTISELIPPFPGVAKEIYTSLAVLRSQGSVVVQDNDFSAGLRPGRVLQILGNDTLTGVSHWVQSVRWNPATGQAQLGCGYPQHLSIRDRLDVRQYLQQLHYGPGQQPNRTP